MPEELPATPRNLNEKERQMKTAEQKYNEAVERNVYNAERNKKNGKNKYQGVGLINVHMALGIRDNDKRFDDRIKELVKG